MKPECTMWSHTYEAVENKEVILGAFLDTEGAFDSTSFDCITKAAKWHGLGDTNCWWISYMLGDRIITTTLAGETPGVWGWGLFPGEHFITFAVQPGCGRIQRTQWEWLLYNGVCKWYNYPNQQKISQHRLRAFQETVRMVQQWCDRTQPSVNPQKIRIVPFTKNGDLMGPKEPTLSGYTLHLTTLDLFWKMWWI